MKYGEAELRRDAKRCMVELWRDDLNHGGDPTIPYYNFVIADGVAVFTIYDDPFEIYIFSCDERELIRTFDEIGGAMRDVGPCKRLLAARYGIVEPVVVAARSLAQLWMESD